MNCLYLAFLSNKTKVITIHRMVSYFNGPFLGISIPQSLWCRIGIELVKTSRPSVAKWPAKSIFVIFTFFQNHIHSNAIEMTNESRRNESNRHCFGCLGTQNMNDPESWLQKHIKLTKKENASFEFKITCNKIRS